MVNKNDILEVKIVDISDEGYGVAKVDGFTLFIENSITDEIVIVRVEKVLKSFGFAKVLELVRPSAYRVVSKDPLLTRVGTMPLQHIADRILLSMGRKVGEKATREAVRKVREKAHCAIRTTFMVGFPGETEEEFQTLLRYVEEQKFARLGAFCYCPEAGTPAASFPHPVPRRTAQRRYEQLLETQRAISLAANRELVGREITVMLDSVEGRGKGFGRTELDAPEIDNQIILRKIPSGMKPGMFARALVRSAEAYDITADLTARKEE